MASSSSQQSVTGAARTRDVRATTDSHSRAVVDGEERRRQIRATAADRRAVAHEEERRRQIRAATADSGAVADEEERRRQIRGGKRAASSSGRGGGEETDGEGEEMDGEGDRRRKRARVLDFLDVEAEVDDDEEEEDEEEEGDDLIIEEAELENEPDQRVPPPAYNAEEDEELDIEEIERRVRERYSRPSHTPHAEDGDNVEQQALLPTLSDPKLYLVKCKIGHEREVAIRLMQRAVQRKELCIFSVVALDHLQNYVYVEAETQANVKEAICGLQNVYISHEPEVIPIEDMTSVLSVDNKIVDVAKGTWVRMRRGPYQGDLAQVVDFDNLKKEVTVKVIPRIDLQYLAKKSASKVSNVIQKQTAIPPPRFFRKEEVRKYRHLRLFKKTDKNLRDGFLQLEVPSMAPMMFKDGFLYKTLSRKSISTSNVEPTFEELEKFKGPCRLDTSGNIPNLSNIVTHRKRGYFMKGDAVVVIRGDLKNLEGWVHKVEADSVHIRSKITGLPETLAFKASDLCKCFNPGERVKVVCGAMEGASGTVVKVEGHVLTVLSDVTKEHMSVFADHAARSAEFTKPLAQIGGYELNDFVQLIDKSFGVITRLESEGLEVLHGVPDHPKVTIVSLREITRKMYKKYNAKDRLNNIISAEDIVTVVEGLHKGKRGTVKYIVNGMLFIYNPRHREHGGFTCTRADSCLLVGGTSSGNVGHTLNLRSGASSSSSTSESRRSPGGVASTQCRNFVGRDKGQKNNMKGKYVKIRCGPYKGYNGKVVGSWDTIVRVELESLMKKINFTRDQIMDASVTAAPTFRDTISLPSARTPVDPSRTPLHHSSTPVHHSSTPVHHSGTPVHPSRTPVHPSGTPVHPSMTPVHHMQTPVHDVGATPIRSGNHGLDSTVHRRR